MRTRLHITMITIVSCFFLCVCVCLIGLLATELIEPMSDVFFYLLADVFCFLQDLQNFASGNSILHLVYLRSLH